MSFHDAYLRVTPFELAFPRAGAGEGRTGPSPVALRDSGVLAFHAVPFEQAGCPVLLLATELCRALTGPWSGAGAPLPPAPAGYAQLPRHLFWVHGAGMDPPEPVDGFFWTVSGQELLHLLLAAGVREGRPGLSVVPIAEAPLADAPSWLHAVVREDGRDFATALPGGELRGLYSLTAAGEALKLAARLFAHLAAVPAAARAGEAGPPHASPAPSRLAYRRVTLTGA